MNKKQSLRALRRQAEREQKAEKLRQATAILEPRDLEERKRLLGKAMAECEEKTRNQAIEYSFRCIYAAVLLAAQEVYGFGHKRAWRLLKRVDEIVCTALSSEEIIQEVWERMGWRSTSGRESTASGRWRRREGAGGVRGIAGGVIVLEHILSLSYGKDSLACLGAIDELGWPLDRIVHADVWATDTIPADLPPMVEFKKKADEIIRQRWGIEVEHVVRIKNGKKLNYESVFYQKRTNKSKKPGEIYGFPTSALRGVWCTGELKQNILKETQRQNIVYLGIASDELNRFHNFSETKKSPLVEAGWTEAMCRQWCEENDLLSPIYTSATRGGCWFCHNQGIEQLRLLRKNYPDLWALMLKWDADSPVTFKADGHTVHDFDKRFQLEDDGIIFPDQRFNWGWLNEVQMPIDYFLRGENDG